MTSNPHATWLPGTDMPPTPYRGVDGGTSTQCADMPSVPNGIGRSAYVVESASYTVCHQVDVPPVFDVPPMRTNRVGWHTQKPTVSRARIGYQKANEEAAEIVLANIAQFGGEQAGLVVWARMIQAKMVPTIRGPLFKAAA